MSIRIVIADDDTLIRTGLRMILATQPDLEVVGEAADGRAAIGQSQALRPDVVLMDVRMPVLDGLSATAAVTALGLPPLGIPATCAWCLRYSCSRHRAKSQPHLGCGQAHSPEKFRGSDSLSLRPR